MVIIPQNRLAGARPSPNSHAKPKPVRSIEQEALRLHEAGFWVVVCDGKKPLGSSWGKSRLPRESLRAMLSQPGRNIAIVLNQSALIDVECDTPEAETALVAMFGGQVPPTPTWRSKRGDHRFFRRPEGLPETAVKHLDGVEFRLGNGRAALSIVPPSVTDGFERHWLPGLSLDDLEPAELPEDVADRLRASGSPPAPDTLADGKINEGERNDTLFKLACNLFASKCPVEAVEAAVGAVNAAQCVPPLSPAEVSGIVRSATSQGTQHKGLSPAALLLQLVEAKAELWHTPDGVGCASVRRNGHLEHHLIRSRGFREWLASESYAAAKKPAGSQTVLDALAVLEGKAKYDGEQHPLFVRVAGHEGRIYVDLADPPWRAIEIDREGWRIVEIPPVRFRRPKGLQPLPVPVPGGSISELRPFLNVADQDWPLVLGWLVAALRPTGPYPVLKLAAEQGTGKTTASRVLRSFIDPNSAPVRSAPKGERDLMIAATNSWLLCFDNLSWIEGNLSDAICRISTGGGSATRSLFTDDEETIFDVQRPVLLNGIEEVGLRSDLLDRSLIVELPRIEPEKRLAESVFWRNFELARPRIFGALLDAIPAALRNLSEVEASGRTWPRMADFAMWAVAGAEPLGIDPEDFLSAYEANREDASRSVLESSLVVQRLREVVKARGGRWTDTASVMLEWLKTGVDTRKKDWPQNARSLSGKLNRLAPNLRQAGWTVEQGRKGNDKTWTIQLPREEAPSEPAPSVSTQSKLNAGSKPAKPGVLDGIRIPRPGP